MWSDFLHRWFFTDEAKSFMSVIGALSSVLVAAISTVYTLRATRREKQLLETYKDQELTVFMENARRNYAETLREKSQPEPPRPRTRPEMPI